MKVLLADPPVREWEYDASYLRLGLLYLAGYLRKFIEDKQLRVEYLGPKNNLKTHLEYVTNFNPQVYGISFTSKEADLAYTTTKAIKHIFPGAYVVCGGVHPTAMPHFIKTSSDWVSSAGIAMETDVDVLPIIPVGNLVLVIVAL